MSRYSQPISDGAVEDLLSRDGVTSVGEGIDQGQRVIIVGVESEAAAQGLPGTVEGFPVRYEVEGPATPASATPPLAEGDNGLPSPVSVQTTGRYRPIPPGVSIGHQDVTAGTASFLAVDGDSLYQLSNSHVLAQFGDASAGDTILQPGPHDGGVEGEDDAGQLQGWIEVGAVDNLVDLAWYEPSADLNPAIFSLDEEPEIESQDPSLGDEVTFVGRTSGVQTATVDRAHTAVNVQASGETRVFIDQFRLDEPLVPGDSGSPILLDTDDGLVPAGIGFSSTDTAGYCNYISHVESESGMDVHPVEPPNGENGGGDNGDTGNGGNGGGVSRARAAKLLSVGIIGAWTFERLTDED